MTALIGTDLRYEVGGKVIVDGVSVTAPSGRLLAISGPSGAGKSTLLALLAGLMAPTSGSIRLGDAPVVAGDLALRRRIGVILQGNGLATALTARENVAVALQARGVGRAEVAARVSAVLAEVGLADVADHLIEELSGGQQQRVAAARALVTTPELLLADEPTAEVDAENRERIVARLTDLARAGSIVVIASHDPDVLTRCDEVLTLDAGRPVHPA
jgi:putative ABC transport system ATP-binding protein